MYATLRDRLRGDTRGAHEALDAAMSRFDLTSPNGLRAFLMTHFIALSRLNRISGAARSRAMISELLARTHLDLSALGRKTPCPDCTLISVPDSLALDYVMSGSRLGSAVLKRRWQHAEHPSVRAANAYFSAPDYIDTWRAFCQCAQKLPPHGDYADIVVKDATALLWFYESCAHQAAQRRPLNIA